MPILTDDRRKELELNYSILKERIAEAEAVQGVLRTAYEL